MQDHVVDEIRHVDVNGIGRVASPVQIVAHDPLVIGLSGHAGVGQRVHFIPRLTRAGFQFVHVLHDVVVGLVTPEIFLVPATDMGLDHVVLPPVESVEEEIHIAAVPGGPAHGSQRVLHPWVADVSGAVVRPFVGINGLHRPTVGAGATQGNFIETIHGGVGEELMLQVGGSVFLLKQQAEGMLLGVPVVAADSPMKSQSNIGSIGGASIRINNLQGGTPHPIVTVAQGISVNAFLLGEQIIFGKRQAHCWQAEQAIDHRVSRKCTGDHLRIHFIVRRNQLIHQWPPRPIGAPGYLIPRRIDRLGYGAGGIEVGVGIDVGGQVVRLHRDGSDRRGGGKTERGLGGLIRSRLDGDAVGGGRLTSIRGVNEFGTRSGGGEGGLQRAVVKATVHGEFRIIDESRHAGTIRSPRRGIWKIPSGHPLKGHQLRLNEKFVTKLGIVAAQYRQHIGARVEQIYKC